MESKEKIRLLKDYIAVAQGEMSKLFFCKKHDVNFREFTKIAYVIEAELVAENKRLKEEHRWIPVSERLPEEGLAVLTLMETGYIGKCTVVDSEWQHLGEDTVTHWKPIILPGQALKEPPKTGE